MPILQVYKSFWESVFGPQGWWVSFYDCVSSLWYLENLLLSSGSERVEVRNMSVKEILFVGIAHREIEKLPVLITEG